MSTRGELIAKSDRVTVTFVTEFLEQFLIVETTDGMTMRRKIGPFTGGKLVEFDCVIARDTYMFRTEAGCAIPSIVFGVDMQTGETRIPPVFPATPPRTPPPSAQTLARRSKIPPPPEKPKPKRTRSLVGDGEDDA